jgi:hypothetical protein
MTKKYQNQKRKLNKLRSEQNQHKYKETQNFHPRIRNLTNIQFNEAECQLISKGLQYNLHYKPKTGYRQWD